MVWVVRCSAASRGRPSLVRWFAGNFLVYKPSCLVILIAIPRHPLWSLPPNLLPMARLTSFRLKWSLGRLALLHWIFSRSNKAEHGANRGGHLSGSWRRLMVFRFINTFCPTINSEQQTQYSVTAAQKVLGVENVNDACDPLASNFGRFIKHVTR